MNPTASGLGRALPCPASEALPQVGEDGRSRPAEIGDVVHDYLEAFERLGRDRDAALATVPTTSIARNFCEQVPVDRLPRGGRREIAVAWDAETDTARVLFEGHGRDYHRHKLKPTEWVGKLDVLGLLDGRAFDIDWKTGFRPASVEQLMFGVLAGTRLLGVDDGAHQFWYFREDGGLFIDPWPEPAIVDELAISAFAARLRDWPRRLEKVKEQIRNDRPPDVVAGSHCIYCKAKPFCPAKVALARSMAGEVKTLGDQLGTLAPAERGKVYARAEEIIDLAKMVRGQLEEMARVEAIPLPDGTWLRERLVKLPTAIKAEPARKVIADLFGNEVAAKAVTVEESTSFTAIKDALRPISKHGQLGKNEKRVEEQLRRVGALVERRSREIRVCKTERDDNE